MDAHPSAEQAGETPKMNGSVLIFVRDSVEEVWKMLREDVYTTSGVWDVDKVSLLLCLFTYLVSFLLPGTYRVLKIRMWCQAMIVGLDNVYLVVEKITLLTYVLRTGIRQRYIL